MGFFDFLSNVPRSGDWDVLDFEALQKARKDLIGELDAIVQYDDHLQRSVVQMANATWVDIRNEELVHVGELLGLLFYLAPYQQQLVEQGLKEFENRLGNKNENGY